MRMKSASGEKQRERRREGEEKEIFDSVGGPGPIVRETPLFMGSGIREIHFFFFCWFVF